MQIRDLSEISRGTTLGARDFSSAVSGFCQVFIVTRASPLVASAYGRRRVGLRPTPKLPAAREKNPWYPGYRGTGGVKFGFGNEVTHPCNGTEIC